MKERPDKGKSRQADILPDLCVQNSKARQKDLFLMKIHLPVLPLVCCVVGDRDLCNLLHIHSPNQFLSKVSMGEGQSEWRRGERWPADFT